MIVPQPAPASMKLSRNHQAESSSNAQHLGLYKSQSCQTHLIHKEGNANGEMLRNVNRALGLRIPG